MTDTKLEDRIVSLESTVSRELRSLHSRFDIVVQTEISWAQKHWGWLLLGTAVVFFILGKLL